MPRKNHNPHLEHYTPDAYVWHDLEQDLLTAQAAVVGCAVGRPLEIPAARRAEIAFSFWREGIRYFTDSPHVNYLAQDGVREATRHHRTERAIARVIAAQVATVRVPAVIARAGISAIELPSDPNAEHTHSYGIMALCEAAWAQDSGVQFNISQEARDVRIGLADDDSYASPWLWLGNLVVKPEKLAFALEQFETGIPDQLSVGPVQLIRHN